MSDVDNLISACNSAAHSAPSQRDNAIEFASRCRDAVVDSVQSAILADRDKLIVAAEEWSLYVVEDCAPVTLVNYLRDALK